MSDSTFRHPLRREGTSRLARLIRALRPDAFQLDERSLQDLIVDTHRYAQTLKYFDETDTQPDKVYWEGFWEMEHLTYLAVLAATDTAEIRRLYEAEEAAFPRDPDAPGIKFGKKLPKGPGLAVYKPLLDQLNNLANLLEEDYRKLVRIGHPLQSLLLNRIRRDNCCDTDEMQSALRRLIALHKGADPALDRAKYKNFKTEDKRWGLRNRVDYDAIPANPSISLETLRELFFTFFDTLLVLKTAAQDGFETELARMERPENEEYRVVQPHIALFLTFLRLFRHAQDSLNGVGKQHLDYFYKEVLALQPHDGTPDTVYLLFELAKGFSEHLLEKGTEFLAGKDKKGRPLVYETTGDWVLRSAQVADIKNTYIDPDTGEIFANPDVKKKYKAHAALPNETAPYWRAMGDDENLPYGEIGFAIASPQLILKEGRRVVDVIIATTSDLCGLYPDDFEVLLSSEKEWIRLKRNPAITFDDGVISFLMPGSSTFNIDFNISSHCIHVRACLDRDVLPVAQPGKDLKTTFNTKWPVLKLSAVSGTGDNAGKNEIHKNIYRVLNNISIEGITIKVSVNGIRENLIIQSDQGVFDGTQKVFPFGPSPEIGSHFYIGSPEVFQKAVKDISLHFDWIDAPIDFKKYYENYTKVGFTPPDPFIQIGFLDGGGVPYIDQIERTETLGNNTPGIDITTNITGKVLDKDGNPITNYSIQRIPQSSVPEYEEPRCYPGYYIITTIPGNPFPESLRFIPEGKYAKDLDPVMVKVYRESGVPGKDLYISTNINVRLFPKQKSREPYNEGDIVKIKGRITDLFGNLLDGVSINTSEDWQNIESDKRVNNYEIAGTLEELLSFEKDGYKSQKDISTNRFPVVDVVLCREPFNEQSGGAFDGSVEGEVRDLRVTPKVIAGINVVAVKDNGAVVVKTKTNADGKYYLPQIQGADALEFFFNDNENDKYIIKTADCKKIVNVWVHLPQIIKKAPAGCRDVELVIRSAYGWPPLSDIELDLSNNCQFHKLEGNAFLLRDVPPETKVDIKASDFSAVSLEVGDSTKLEVLLIPATGQSILTGSGAPANTVELAFADPAIADGTEFEIKNTKYKITNGKINISNINAPEIITLLQPGFKLMEVEVEPENEYTISMAPEIYSLYPGNEGEIVGRIIDLEGKPVKDAAVEGQSSSFSYTVITDDDGKFTIPLPKDEPGAQSNYRIVATYGGPGAIIEASYSESDLSGQGIILLAGLIKKYRPFTGTIFGTVFRPGELKNLPLEGVKVMVRYHGKNAVTDNFGRYTITDLPVDAPLDIAFVHPNYHAVGYNTIYIVDNAEINITLFPIEVLYVTAGRISDIFNNPLYGAVVGLRKDYEGGEYDFYELCRSHNGGEYEIKIPGVWLETNVYANRMVFVYPGFSDLKVPLREMSLKETPGSPFSFSILGIVLYCGRLNFYSLLDGQKTIKENFPVVTSGLHLNRDIRTQEFDRYTPTLKRGFIRLTLNGGDFLHKEYPKVLLWHAINAGKEGKVVFPEDGSQASVSPVPNPPYTPATNGISLDYTSVQTITGEENRDLDGNEIDQYFYLLPFNGHKKVDLGPKTASVTELDVQLIYPYTPSEDRPDKMVPGNLFIGLSDLQPGSNLSLLIQVAEGTEMDPEKERPEMHWSCLTKDNTWTSIPKESILNDETRGLTRSGMIQIKIPFDIVRENTMLNPEYYWLRVATVKSDTSSVQALPAIVDIRAQVVQARFKNIQNERTADNLPLPAQQINRLAFSHSAVKTVEQPMESFGGRLPENAVDNLEFYYRVSERLRHKDRAVTVWDYERLLLERFATISTAKCIPHTRYDEAVETNLAPTFVSVAVIPNLDKRKGEPWPEPRFTRGDLEEMRDFLAGRANLLLACTEPGRLKVLNPLYEKVGIEVHVEFKSGEDKAFRSAQLKKELINYVSTWLNDPEKPPVFGRILRRSGIIQFIEERPYVDYIDIKGETPGGTPFIIKVEGSQVDTEHIRPGTSRSILAADAENILVSSTESAGQQPAIAPVSPTPVPDTPERPTEGLVGGKPDIAASKTAPVAAVQSPKPKAGKNQPAKPAEPAPKAPKKPGKKHK